ncbi:MAG: putative colanic acid biosynthesis acetyltransferase [Pseudomonas sp. PGPPP3]|nr:MAG: putative colanic acid biosynthesis acetyltransferase [Pseudomonas sp. PGPPP3]
MILQGNDPYTSPSFSLAHRVKRQLWNWVWLFLFRPSPRPLNAWRATLLRIFGAQLGRGVHVYPSAKVWAPWNLCLGDFVGVADGVNIYNMDMIKVGDFSVISQGAHLCGGSHDYNSKNFQLFSRKITLGKHVWICADAFVSLDVSIPDGVVVGARSVVTKSIADAWSVYAGHPAKKIGNRQRHDN